MNLKKLFGSSEKAARVEKILAARTPSRPQHYTFAHKLLPSIAHDVGVPMILALGNPQRGHGLLLSAWENAGEGVPPGEHIAPDDLRASVARAGDKLIATIQLPAPITSPEAHFVAIMSDLPPEPPQSAAEEAQVQAILAQMSVRYFTLELGFTLDANEPVRTAFCEWTRDGQHLNMGDGPNPDEESWFGFLATQNFPPVQGSFSPGAPDPVQDHSRDIPLS